MKIVFIYFLVNFIIRWLLGVIIKKTLKLIGNALYYFNEVCDKYIKFIMKNKYIKIEELQRSMVIKVKYIIRYFRDIIIRTSYKYTLNIRDLIRISMFNIMCLLFTCKYFEIDVDLTFFYELIEKYILLNGNIRGHIMMLYHYS